MRGLKRTEIFYFLLIVFMAQIFTRLTGRQNVRFIKHQSGTAVAIGDLVSVDDDTGDLLPTATDKLVGGIALDSCTATSTAVLRYDVLVPGDVVRAKLASGTGALTLKGYFLDIATAATGLTTTSSNNDAVCVGWDGDSTSYCNVRFTSLQENNPPTTTSPD